MEVSSLSSTLFPNRPSHGFNPFSKKWQSQRLIPAQYVSCKARKLAIEVKEITTENFYKMLSLNPKSATNEEIKKAYRSMALQYHPDVCLDPLRKEKCTRMFVQLHAAYETLSDPVLRQEYDYELGLITSKRNNSKNVNGGGERWRRRWEQQVVELKRRSDTRMAQKENSSWGSRIRAQNMKNDK
ncbi:chaperone protein dnaJ 20, chloroplastic-like [Prosopis cineraria]|uniref:chaperone protein dnaJ 20, chloroplastic-like n=1 Tax=Prosopis cineraria TaxID=364024 RepID=UPI0024108ADA|nr:chaperone protein dnaJ 20, chloroplastic-like [Prosopis cineraria]